MVPSCETRPRKSVALDEDPERPAFLPSATLPSAEAEMSDRPASGAIGRTDISMKAVGPVCHGVPCVRVPRQRSSRLYMMKLAPYCTPACHDFLHKVNENRTVCGCL